MFSEVLLYVIAILIIYISYKWMFYKPPNFPPGPPRIPYFNSYVFMLLVNYKHMHKAADFLCKYYKTNILGCYFASTPTIIVNDAASVKEALFTREFDGKPSLLLAELREPEFKIRGIFFTEGPQWKEQRRFFLRYLRDFGFGRRFEELELETRDEFKMFIDIVKNGPKYEHEKNYIKDGNILTPIAFCPYLVNSYMKIVFNERVPRHEQHKFTDVIDYVSHFQRVGDSYGRLFSHVPIISKIFPESSDYKSLREGAMKTREFMKELIDRQIATYDSNFERNFLDMYMTKMKEAEANGDKDTSFTYEQLIMISLDFFIPALTAVGFTVTQLFQVLCENPEIQKKIHAEIDNVVGQGSLPRLDDRINMPYTEASLREIMRYKTIVPSGIPHKSLEDTIFMGYDIPKGSIIVTSLHGSNMDTSAWDEPELFKPERFLGDDGMLSLKKDHSVPFGAGKRLCAGETFARNSMFLLVSALLQNFTVKAPEGQKIPCLSQTSTGLLATSPNFWIRLEPR